MKKNDSQMKNKEKHDLEARTETIKYQRELDACVVSISKWNKNLSHLKAKREKLLTLAEKQTIRKMQKVISEKTITIHLKNKDNKKTKLTLTQNSKLILKLRKNMLSCASIIQANGQIIARRQQVYRNHIERKIICKASQDKYTKVISGKMGSYKSLKKKMEFVDKFLGKRAKELKKGKSKNYGGVEVQSNIVESYINDIKFKKWSLNWSVNQINSFNCETL